MSTLPRSSIVAAVASATLALLLGSGCATSPSTSATPSPAEIGLMEFSYPATPSKIKIDASATVEASAALTPEMRLFWRRWVTSDRVLDGYLQAVAGALSNDLTASGLFASILAPGSGKPDYVVRIRSEESDPSNFRLRVTMTVLDPASGQELFTRTGDVLLGLSGGGPDNRSSLNMARTPNFPPDVAGRGYSGLHLLTGTARSALQQMMPVLKLGVGEFLRKAKGQPVVLPLQAASLPDLLVATDESVDLARDRNRALVAAKTRQLPDILRSWKTDELTSLVVRIEQTMLDLNHESEVAKDRAQQAAAANDDQLQSDELRGLSISYRERIELLKPIVAALKEEIANRNR